jgi:hypothetical protein
MEATVTTAAVEDLGADVYRRALALLKAREEAGAAAAAARRRAAPAARRRPPPPPPPPAEPTPRPEWDDRLLPLPGGLFDPALAKVRVTGPPRRSHSSSVGLVERTMAVARSRSAELHRLERALEEGAALLSQQQHQQPLPAPPPSRRGGSVASGGGGPGGRRPAWRSKFGASKAVDYAYYQQGGRGAPGDGGVTGLPWWRPGLVLPTRGRFPHVTSEYAQPRRAASAPAPPSPEEQHQHPPPHHQQLSAPSVAAMQYGDAGPRRVPVGAAGDGALPTDYGGLARLAVSPAATSAAVERAAFAGGDGTAAAVLLPSPARALYSQHKAQQQQQHAAAARSPAASPVAHSRAHRPLSPSRAAAASAATQTAVHEPRVPAVLARPTIIYAPPPHHRQQAPPALVPAAGGGGGDDLSSFAAYAADGEGGADDDDDVSLHTTYHGPQPVAVPAAAAGTAPRSGGLLQRSYAADRSGAGSWLGAPVVPTLQPAPTHAGAWSQPVPAAWQQQQQPPLLASRFASPPWSAAASSSSSTPSSSSLLLSLDVPRPLPLGSVLPDAHRLASAVTTEAGLRSLLARLEAAGRVQETLHARAVEERAAAQVAALAARYGAAAAAAATAAAPNAHAAPPPPASLPQPRAPPGASPSDQLLSLVSSAATELAGELAGDVAAQLADAVGDVAEALAGLGLAPPPLRGATVTVPPGR